jgi:tetratricopeptide (TPR) repeat protein
LVKTSAEIFNEKVSLIYEYDKKSPLFVRQANIEIENNNVEKAVEILDNGITGFPSYITAYILLGKAHMLLGSYSLALKNFKKGCELSHSKRSLDHYISEIENIKKQRALFESGSRSSYFSADSIYDKLDSAGVDESLSEPLNGENVDDRLDEIARKISSAKFSGDTDPAKKTEEKFKSISEKHVIISDTLAKIYEAQGEYKEVIEIYTKLIDKNPEKEEFYAKRIEEVKSKMNG